MEGRRHGETSGGVPFLDLRQQHESLKDSILADIAAVAESGRFINGRAVGTFERAFAAYVGTTQCVGVSSGLDALRLGLIAAGLSAGDEVVVPANTFVATLEAVSQAGGRPVIVDVSELDYNLDVQALEAALGGRTRFVVPVHLYGQMADMRAVLELVSARDIEIVEDACQAHGAERDGLRAGAVGSAAAFSFYPAKNLGAWGDAGAVTTSSDAIAARVRALRDHGQEERYLHELEGYTARLDTIQALVLARKLSLLDPWNRERSQAARFYAAAFQGVGDVLVPPVPPGSAPAWHLFPLRTAKATALGDFLSQRGIETARHYPQPPHLSGAYARLGYPRGSFPVAERLADELLSLPLFPGITREQLATVVDAVTAFFQGRRTAVPSRVASRGSR